MKILAPTNSPDEVRTIIQSGADELYCGVLSKEWKRKYTNVASINRREFALSNMKSYDELERSVKIAHSFDVPVLFTMNGLYTEEQHDFVIKEIKKAIDAGIDSLIIADLALLLKLKELEIKTKIQISTGATVFNSKTINFYKKLGITRFTLPRQMTIEEMKKIIKNNIKIDVFIMNARCINEDGFCTFQHGINEIIHPFLGPLLKKKKYDFFVSSIIRRLPNKLYDVLVQRDILSSLSACYLYYNVSSLKSSEKGFEKIIASNFGLKHFPNQCGACSLYDFHKMNVNAVKIVGRQNPTSKKIKDVKFLVTLRNYLDSNPNEREFKKRCKKEFIKFFGIKCDQFQCYYNTV
ncbi:MAG: U32 family peptidase [Nanoarchaeota archaeon]